MATNRRDTEDNRIAISGTAAAAIVTVCCAVVIWGAHLLFSYVEFQRGINDSRDEQVTFMFAGLVAVFWVVSMFRLLRHRTIKV